MTLNELINLGKEIIGENPEAANREIEIGGLYGASTREIDSIYSGISRDDNEKVIRIDTDLMTG